MQPDTPRHSPARKGEGSNGRAAYNLNGHEEPDEASEHSAQGYDRPDQTVFDLTMDNSDDETLLDWEQYAGMRKFKCWGLDCSLVARFCPFMPWVPPEWYYRYSRRQRRLMMLGFSLFVGLLVLLIGATVLVSLLPSQETPAGLGYANEECIWSNYRLPRNHRPTQYDLDISVQLEPPFLVTGVVQVAVNVGRPSRCMVLHAVDMNITHVSRLDPHTDGSWKFNNQEQLILEFEDAIRPPSASFALHFNYMLKEGLSGFYRSNYTVANGETRIMGTTQMESNGARKAFPCFDEPALKAKWNLSMTAPSDQVVLANMPLASAASLSSGQTRHAFETTPPMPSYLVAFIVGNLTRVSSTVPYPHGTGPDRPVSIWGTPDRKESLQVALQVATKVLPAYEELLGVPYALPKLDLVAIPDFGAGAMENWGLITYRETALLVNANDSSISNERRVVLVIAHEMAHLWFGDLVTMRDWGELWLNEGFASYFENLAATIARPNFAYFETFYPDFTASALAVDAMPKSTHPLATLTGMDTSEKIEAMFDPISYEKGGSVLRMLRAYLAREADKQPLLRRSLLQDEPPAMLPEEPFLKGLQSYLEKYAYNNTSSQQLWAEMDAAVGEDVSGWMRAWTYQPGFPRVQILLDGPLKRELKVYQAPFENRAARTCDDSPGGVKAGTAPWWIPLASVTRDGSSPSWTTFSGCVMEPPVYILQDDEDWIKLNAGQYGLFRVNYPVSLWTRLADAAAAVPAENTAPAVSAVDLAGLLDDSWALAQAGDSLSITHFLQLTRSLVKRQAPEYAPWLVAGGYLIDIFRYLQLHAPDPGCADRWAAFVRANVTTEFLAANSELQLNATLADSADAAQSDVQPRLLRPLLLGLAAEFNDTGVREQAVALFSDINSPAWKQDVDIRGNVYRIVASSGRREDYEAIKNLYLMATDANEKARSLIALAFAPTPAQINETLEFSLSDAVRAQDTTSLIVSVAARSRLSLQAAWDFVRTRYADIAAKLGGETEAASAMGRLLQRVASRLADDSAIQEVDEVFRAHRNVLTEPRLQEAAKEDIMANMDWLRKNAGPVCDWLNHL